MPEDFLLLLTQREITSINNAVRSRQVDDKNKEWCNCRGRKKDQTICPLNGYCQKASIIYKADISSNGKERTYVGSTGGAFKTRYAQHKASLAKENHRNPTALSTYYWTEKNKGNQPKIKWSIIKNIKGKYTEKMGALSAIERD